MVSKVILAAAVIVVVLVVGGIYFMQQPSTPTVTTPISTPTTPSPTIPPTETKTPTPTETATTTPTPTETPTPTPTVSEEDTIREMLDGYFRTFSKATINEQLEFFTDNAVKIDQGREFRGLEQIEFQLKTRAFGYCPNASLLNIEIVKVEIDSNAAEVEAQYDYDCPKYSRKYPTTEKMELVKEDGVWKIAKTVIISDFS